MAIDATLRSALTCEGAAHARADEHNGAVLADAKREKCNIYPELVSNPRCRLVVVGVETGGRFSEDTSELLAKLAQARAQSAPKHLQFAARLGFERRWARILACRAAWASVAALVMDKETFRAAEMQSSTPWLADVLADARRDIVGDGCTAWDTSIRSVLASAEAPLTIQGR